MITLKDKKDCCGCEACLQICPKKCINIEKDNEGFIYPNTNIDICIDCNLCNKVCPVLNQEDKKIPKYIFASKNKNEQIREESSSGGIFTLLAEKIIEKGGVVFGAKFNSKWEVVHDYTEHSGELTNFRGSKYTQSKINNNFIQVKTFLDSDRLVLFSGTPCQVHGLNLFLRKKYTNLLTIDIVCHGVPSPEVFRKYVNESFLKNSNSKIEKINFRDKKSGWKNYNFSISYSENNVSKTFTEPFRDNVFFKGFLSDLYLRPSCHACPSKKLRSNSDITIGDYWGIEKVRPDFYDDKGVSLLLINSEKGYSFYKMIDTESIETGYHEASRYNSCLENSVKIHPNRKHFFDRYQTEDVSHLIIELKNDSVKNKVFNRLTRFFNK